MFEFNSGEELLKLCAEHNMKISEVVLCFQMQRYRQTKEEIYGNIIELLTVMESSSKSAIENPVKTISGMLGGEAKAAYLGRNNDTLSGSYIMEAMAMSLSTSETNATMGKIVAAPTAGAAGILPASLMILKKKYNLKLEDLIDPFLAANGIGIIVAKNATFAGAEGGCQAECGSASAMASAGIVEYMGGSPEQCLTAAGLCLSNVMGLVCDPVAGLVEYPCAFRNSSGVVNAITTADLVLAGIGFGIPFDEVLDISFQVGKAMPEALRETALGGLAISKTACKIRDKVFGE